MRPSTYVIGLLDVATSKFSAAGRLSFEGKSDLLPLDFWWKGPRRLLVRVVSTTGRHRGFAAFDIDGKNPEEFHHIELNGGIILDPLPAEPNSLLMANAREAYRLDMRSGKTTTEAGNLGYINQWLVDTKGNVRAAATWLRSGERILYWQAAEGGEWRPYKMKPEDRGIRPVGFDADPRYLWVWDFGAYPANRVSKFDTQDGSIKPVVGSVDGLEPTNVLMVGPSFHQAVLAAYSQANPVRLEPLAESQRPAINLLQERFKGAMPRLIGIMPDNRRWIVSISTSRFPGGYFFFDAQTGAVSLIATSHNPALKQNLFVESSPVSVAARGSGTIRGRVWLPRAVNRPPVIVICPSALPAMPASNEFDPFIQAMADQGYAVAVFDGRGTVGYGHATDILDQGTFAKCMQEDLEDGVAGLATMGLVDGGRAVLLGNGMGGAVAQAVPENSDKFRAVVSINAPVEINREDLLTFSSDTSENALASRLGGWRASAHLADTLSPLKVAPRLKIPALHLMDEAAWSHGKPSDDARRLEKAVHNSPAPARVELAYSWFEGFTPPSIDQRERATVALRIADFYQQTLGLK